jgi:glycerate kinase
LKIVIAPQNYKGCLSSSQVAQAIATGIKRVLPEAKTVLLPMADGGEGTVDALVHSTHGRTMVTEVTGPLGDKVEAAWGILGDGVTAVIEMAAASGITLVPKNLLNPLIATTYGTGELIKAALDAKCRKIVIGIGGSATNDGGAGMAQALGVKLLDKYGRELPRGGAALAKLARIDVSWIDKRLINCQITVASDVNNPLCGSEGASRVYGPQKGAVGKMIEQLDQALSHYGSIIKKDLGVDILNVPGAGAAGGLGAGLIAFLKATLMPGVDVVSDAVGLIYHLKGASLVFTGEGRLDSQTLFGKTIAGVAAKAKELGVQVIAIVGSVEGEPNAFTDCGIDAVMSIASGPMSLDECLTDADKLIADATERALRLVRIRFAK